MLYRFGKEIERQGLIVADATPRFTLLVNSSDGFEDCWVPFFTLLTRYWPDLKVPIVLNTELKRWSFKNLDIKCTQSQFGHPHQLSWSQCLVNALDQISTDLVLYMQEDYFIEQPVDHGTVCSLAELMTSTPEIKHIGLTHFGSAPPFWSASDNRLWTISPTSRYRVSCQAGLWRKDALKSLVLPWENGWMFELFGTVRSARRREQYLTVRRDAGSPPIIYQHTGIVKGRWSHFVPHLFACEGISVDFSKRGFNDASTPAIIRQARLLGRIASHPILALKSICMR